MGMALLSHRRAGRALVRLLLVLGILTLPLLSPASGEAVTDLRSRLDEAIRVVDTAISEGGALPDPDALFPTADEVRTGEVVYTVDHGSLRAEWGRVARDPAKRREALERLRRRLVAVRAELDRSPAASPGPPTGWQERLAEVMARPELSKKEVQEPLYVTILRWLAERLGFLFPETVRKEAGKVTTWIVLLLAAVALLLAVVTLIRTVAPGFRRNRTVPATPASRPEAPETPEGARAAATARAAAGDFRGALQAAFRWVLLSLHRRGQLDYEPALTNRQHLRRLTAESSVRTAFERLTRDYDAAWYGLRPVAAEEYADFERRCRTVAGGAV
jgi:hypothetical protein